MARKKSGNGNGGARPVLQFEYVERQALPKCEIDVRVLEMLKQYPSYIRDVTGREPTVADVIEKGLDKVLSSDPGFREWQSKQAPQTSDSPAQEKARMAGTIASFTRVPT